MRTMVLAAFWFAAVLVSSTASGGRVYHVSPGGDDRGEGSRTSPWKTVQRAADAVKPSDTVFIQTDIYREKVQVRRSGTAAAPITFAAAEGARPVLSASEVLPGPWKNHGWGLFSCPAPEKREVPGWLFIDGAHANHALVHSPTRAERVTP
jgi:hypothetical protein